MQAAAITSRFLTGYSSIAGFPDAESVVSNQGLLPHFVAGHLIRIVHSQRQFLKLTNEVIQFAEQAFLRRDLDSLEEASQVLASLPVDAPRQIGLYYHALAIKRRGDLDAAQTLFEAVADNGPLAYRARGIQGLGANYLSKGQLDEALRFQLEALRAASDKNAHGLQTMLMAHWDIAIVRGLAGDHKGALACFEKLLPLVSKVAKRQPFYVYKYHNALAVELSETGRIEEAKAASKIALASPFAPAYPEWSETRDEIAAKRTSATPSIVSLNRAPKAPYTNRWADVQPVEKRELQLNPDLEPQPKPEPYSALTFSRPAGETLFQISLITIAAGAPTSAATTNETRSILEWMLLSIGPRAPPTFR
ncbi:MAG: tetratricopeptide repeat protein [Acidobacteriota bacterium]